MEESLAIVRPPLTRLALLSTLATLLCLVGGMGLGLGIGVLIHAVLPGHMFDPRRIAAAALATLLGLLLGGAAWGVAIGRIMGTGADDDRRLALTGALGFGPVFIIVAILLTVLEQLIVERGMGPAWPIHDVFTLLFVPATAVVAGVSALSLTLGLGYGARSLPLGLFVGLVTGLTFLAVNRAMQTAGWVVGAPGAAERATMITVLAVGSLAAAVAGGAALGGILAYTGTR